MKKASIVLLLCCGFLNSAQATDWVEDSELSGFETTTLSLQDDYDGVAIATVIRQRNSEASQKAVLYIHGYSDYFLSRRDGSKISRQWV